MNAAALAREALTVPETLAADDLLAEMRRRGVREALVIDEYGGTAGLVTFESLMERIVGDLGDGAGRRASTCSPDGSAEIDGLALVAEVNEQFGLHIDEDTYTTVGGLRAGTAGTPAARRRHDRRRRPHDARGGARRDSRVAACGCRRHRDKRLAPLTRGRSDTDSDRTARTSTKTSTALQSARSSRSAFAIDDDRRAGVGDDRHPERRARRRPPARRTRLSARARSPGSP